MSRLRVGVLVSGRGSNLQALIEAGKDPMYPARVVMVCANRDCAALELAKKASVSREVFRLANFPDRKARDLAMGKTLRMHDVELVVCAGYDAILERVFIRQFEGRIVNIHPSLLPDFAGTMDAVAMALQAGVKETGCTVHLVTDDVDQGPILAQRRVEVRPDDTVESLRERIQAEEHALLPVVVKRLAGQPLPLTL
ncbi:MAG: phosphoribosylglycinamide formyltransferase 1 [Chloroflexota bacterium]|nr:phosphoribosylglycinamide formyltransferase 1 [Chloroflexota bacterium]MEA2669763.1 phosphoribosylglycinamide formyltransferase 1 [Chloroflexota bacterium]